MGCFFNCPLEITNNMGRQFEGRIFTTLSTISGSFYRGLLCANASLTARSGVYNGSWRQPWMVWWWALASGCSIDSARKSATCGRMTHKRHQKSSIDDPLRKTGEIFSLPFLHHDIADIICGLQLHISKASTLTNTQACRAIHPRI